MKTRVAVLVVAGLMVLPTPRGLSAQGSPPDAGSTTAPAVTSTQPPQQPPPPPRVVFKITGDLGFVSSGGNSSVQTLNLGHKIVAKSGKTTITEQFSLVHGRSKGETVTSLWQGGLRADYALPSVFGSYVSMQYERNTFSGLRSRVTSNLGLTAHLVREKNHKFSVEGGATLTAQRFMDVRKADVDALGGRAALIYNQKVGSASIGQNIELLPNFRESEKFRANTETSISSPISRQVGLKLSFRIRYDGAPRPGYRGTDRYFTSGLTLSF